MQPKSAGRVTVRRPRRLIFGPNGADGPAAGPGTLPSGTASPRAVQAAPLRPAAESGPVSGDATDQQIANWLADDRSTLQAAGPNAGPAEAPTPADDFGGDPAAAAPRRIHGEVGASIGSRGYREAYGVVSMPVGQASEVDVAVADAHANFRHGGGVEQKSIALGVFLDGGDVGRALGHDGGNRCDVPRWGVAEKGDPVVNPDGTCAPKADGARGR